MEEENKKLAVSPPHEEMTDNRPKIKKKGKKVPLSTETEGIKPKILDKTKTKKTERAINKAPKLKHFERQHEELITTIVVDT